MNKFYKFIAMFIAIFAFTAYVNAQTWTAPEPAGTTFTTGTGYYLYNVGAKAFLDRGGEWASQAIVSPLNGSKITPTASSTLWILQYESASKTLFPANVADGWTYTDNTTSNTWDIQLTSAEKSEYSIQINNAFGGYNASQYLGASATTYSSNSGVVYDVRYNRAASDFTKWRFCTAAEVDLYKAKVKLDKYMSIVKLTGKNIDLTGYITTYNAGVTADINTATTNLLAALAPENKTSTIANATFDAAPTTGWTGTTGYGYNNTEVEYYGKTFDLYQTINSLPAGVYMLKAQGFERPAGLSTTTQDWYNNGWDARSSKLYATVSGVTTTEAFKSIFAETTSPTGSTINSVIYPNSMANAYDAFTAGLYENELSYFVVDGTGTLKIGIKGDFRSNGNYTMSQWVLFDNFRLYYFGPLAIPNMTTSTSSLFITNAVGTSKTFAVTGANLTGDISVTAPAGISLSATNLVNNGSGSYTIGLANANSTNTITATWDEVANIKDTIRVSCTGVSTSKIVISTSKDLGCFTPLFSSRTNLVSDPYLNNLSNFGGWGAKTIVTDPAYVYCGGTSGKVGDGVGTSNGSIDVSLSGKIDVSKTYRVHAMVKTVGGDFQLGVFGWSNGQADINNVVNTSGAWQELDFTFTTGTALGGTQGMFWNNYQRTGTEGYIDNWEMYDITDLVTGTIAQKDNLVNVFVRNNKIMVSLNVVNVENAEASIYSINGMLLSTQKLNLTSGITEKQLNANLPAGAYVVKVVTDGKSYTQKVIK